MKKFLIPLLLIVAIMMSTAIVEAADVPGFYQVGGRYLTFTGKEVDKKKAMRVYGYDCSVDLREDFAEQFMNSLYNFRLVGHYFNDYIKTSAETFEYWVFVYTRGKNVSTFVQRDYQRKRDYNAHLVVGRHKNWQRETTHFSIKIANGLTYGDD